MDNTEAEYLWGRRSAIQLRALMNRIYYQERQRIFETREGGIKVVAIRGGSLVSAMRSAEWALLERDIELAGLRDFSEVDLSRWAARCNEIEAGEPAAHPDLMNAAIRVHAQH